MPQLSVKHVMGILVALTFLFGFLFINSLYFQTEAGYTYHYQNRLSGSVEIYTEPGVHLKVPFFSTVTRYKQVITVSFGSMTRSDAAIKVLFADTYTGQIPATFRYKLPLDHEKIKRIHREFRSLENLNRSLLYKTSLDVVVNTATQYTGEEFFQGGLNEFKAALADQLRNGIYKTKRQQVEIKQMSLAPIGLGQESSTHLQQTATLVWKTVPVLDENGHVVRLENPLEKYGIEVNQITLDGPVPEQQLQKLLSDKKRLVADRIKAVQEQETAKEQAKTAQLHAEIERTKAKQQALKMKELAVISMQRQVEVAEKQKDKEVIEYKKAKELAEIDKSKELAIAQANLAIQKANFEAAQFEAKAIREKGVAEADVLKAKYKARIPEIYLAEIQKDIAAIIYPNLRGIQVTMPHNVINLGGKTDKLPTNLDVLSSFATIGVMEGLERKALDNKAGGN